MDADRLRLSALPTPIRGGSRFLLFPRAYHLRGDLKTVFALLPHGRLDGSRDSGLTASVSCEWQREPVQKLRLTAIRQVYAMLGAAQPTSNLP